MAEEKLLVIDEVSPVHSSTIGKQLKRLDMVGYDQVIPDQSYP